MLHHRRTHGELAVVKGLTENDKKGTPGSAADDGLGDGARTGLAYALAIILAPAAVAFRAGVGPELGDQPGSLLYLLPVMACAWLGGWGPGFAATAISVAGVAKYVMPELSPQLAAGRGYWVQLAALAMSGAVTSTVVARLVGSRRSLARDRERTREALSLTQAAFESTADGLLVVDLDGRASAFNRRFVAMWRLPEALAESRDNARMLEWVVGQLRDPEAFLQRVLELQANPDRESFDVLPFRDGRVFERYSRPQRIGERIVGRVWSFRDVTAQASAEAALRRSEEGLRRAQAVAHTGSWHVLPAGGRVEASAETLRIFGLASGTAITPRAFLALVHPADRRPAAHAWRAALRGETVDFEHRIVTGGATRWVRERAQARRDGDGALVEVTGTTQDVTERRLAEAAMLRSQKLESLGTLAGGIAHDFNNILYAIQGNARLAAGLLPAGHAAAEAIAEIERAGHRASVLVGRILAFSRPPRGERRPVDLRPVVQEAVQLVRATLPAMIEIRARLPEALPAVAIDPTDIHQVIVNLATNAAHAIGRAAGRIEIALEPGADGQVRLRVSDTGCGMDAALLERIYDPFFTTKPQGEGTGLGLSVVHGIVTRHGGTIAVESEPGRGTTFRVGLPSAGEPAAPPPAPEPRATPGRRVRVLYVDDEDAIVRLITRSLGRLGHEVTAFADPREALARYRADPSAFDVVVTDLAMPGLTGFELARAVREANPAAAVILTSGYVRAEDEDAARGLGIAQVLLKPSTVEALAQAVDRALAAGPAGAPAAGPGGA